MASPAPSKKSAAYTLVPIIGGFFIFTAIAAFNQRIAFIIAIGTISFAVISMLIALCRKH